MSILNEYQNLLKDTLVYLENVDDKFVETNSDFFQKEILNFLIKKTKPQHIDIADKKKYNQNIQTSIKDFFKDAKKETKTVENPESNKTQILKNNEKKDDLKKNPPLISKNFTTNKTSQIKEPDKLPINKLIETKKIKRDEKPKIFEDSFVDIKKSVENLFPNISLLKDPIDDKLAKQKSQKYKLKNIASSITILAYKENEKHYRFLEKLSIALDVYFYPSKVVSAYLIEKENNWGDFLKNDISLIISSDYTIFELAYLRTYYRENPSKGEKFLKDIPLFLLPDISLYLKEPSLKKSLFNALKQKIANLKNDK